MPTAKILSERNEPPILFVLLGASNLARGYTALTQCFREGLYPRPVEFLRAIGPGRGYCARGGIFTITYPPIGSCPVFDAAVQKSKNVSRVVALVTDIGNDIMYEISAEEIVSCLNFIFEKLVGINADVWVTCIPVDLEQDVTDFQFGCLRRMFFPHSRIEKEQAAVAVKIINEFLLDSAKHGIHLLPDMKPFCGADKIHYSLIHSHRAWNLVAEKIFEVLKAGPSPRIGVTDSLTALFANMGRLFFSDLIPIRKPNDGTF